MATNQHSQDIRISQYGVPEATETATGYMLRANGEILSDKNSRPHGYMDLITFDWPMVVKIRQMDLTQGSVVNVTGDLSVHRYKGRDGWTSKPQIEVEDITLVSRVDTRQMTEEEREKVAAQLGISRKREGPEQTLAALLSKPEMMDQLAALLGRNGQTNANPVTGEVIEDEAVIEEATEPPTGNGRGKRRERAA